MRYVTWDEMSPARRAWEAVGAALVWGVICGLLLAVSTGFFLAGGVVACAGAVIGGSQHDDLRGALVRGVLGGVVFGLAVLLGFELTGGTDPVVELPDPRIAYLLVTAIPALPLNAIGWRLAPRMRPALAG